MVEPPIWKILVKNGNLLIFSKYLKPPPSNNTISASYKYHSLLLIGLNISQVTKNPGQPRSRHITEHGDLRIFQGLLIRDGLQDLKSQWLVQDIGACASWKLCLKLLDGWRHQTCMLYKISTIKCIDQKQFIIILMNNHFVSCIPRHEVPFAGLRPVLEGTFQYHAAMGTLGPPSTSDDGWVSTLASWGLPNVEAVGAAAAPNHSGVLSKHLELILNRIPPWLCFYRLHKISTINENSDWQIDLLMVQCKRFDKVCKGELNGCCIWCAHSVSPCRFEELLILFRQLLCLERASQECLYVAAITCPWSWP